MCVYWSEETKCDIIGHCVCERSEWEILERTRRSHLPKDYKLLKKAWRQFSSLNLELFVRAYSNHYRFSKIRVLSHITEPFDFKAEILSQTKKENDVGL